jgi:hypothetical protein
MTYHDEGYKWDSTITQSNETWPTILNYQWRSVFYQNRFLVCWLNELLSNFTGIYNDKIIFEINNGKIETNYRRSFDEYDWDSWGSSLILDLNEHKDYFFIIKPLEKDENFNLTVTLKISNLTSEIYSEKHEFRIIGEPKVIPGEDLNEEVGFFSVCLESIFIALFVFLFVLLFILRKYLFRVPKK